MPTHSEPRHAALRRRGFHTRYSGGLLLIFGALLLGTLAGVAQAEEYWYSYQGNDFPENEGWSRFYGGAEGHGIGGADRRIEDGVLVMDSLDDIEAYDGYSMYGDIDPDADETFVMRWRLRVDEVSVRQDPSIAVFSDDSWAVGLVFSESEVVCSYQPAIRVSFEPGEFHEYEFLSHDMREYELRIDGATALTGEFLHVIDASRVSWGDGVVGSASVSRWDYFEFGVVHTPEPTGILLLLGGTLLLMRRRPQC